MNYPYENFDTFTLPKLLERSVKLYGERPLSAKVGQEPMSYAEFDYKVTQMAKLLQENGIQKGDRVALLAENMPHWGVAYFAITSFGAVVVPILVDFHANDVHHILKHAEVKAIFVSQKHLQTIEEYEGKNLLFGIELDSLTLLEQLTNKDYLTTLKQKAKEQFDKLTNQQKEVLQEDIAAIIYTSGTTGHSKGVMLSHKNLVTNAMSAYIQVKIYPEDSFLSILPLAHTFECTVGLIIPILHGSSVYYIQKAPTPSVLLKAFNEVKPTMMVSVPLIIEKIYKSKILPNLTSNAFLKFLYKISFFRKILNKKAGQKMIDTFGGRLRFYGIGGAKLATYVEEFLIEADFPYIIGYGLTETSPLIAGSILGGKKKLGSTGVAMAGVEIMIDKEDENAHEGEILVKSPSVMMGYYKDEKQTQEVIQNGWFKTGDLGYLDNEGYLFISGRSKNVIIGPAGENIYPEQIESHINKNEFVADALVLEQDGKLIARIHLDYDLIDKKFGTKNLTEPQIKEKIDELLEQMRLELNNNVSSFSKVTKFIEQREAFIKTPTKKIKRYLYT